MPMFLKNKESKVVLYFLLNLPFVIVSIHFLGKLAMYLINISKIRVDTGLYFTYIFLPIIVLFYIMFMLIILFSSSEKVITNINYFLFIIDLLILVYFFFYYSYDASQVDNYYEILENL